MFLPGYILNKISINILVLFLFRSKFFITHDGRDVEQAMIQQGRTELGKCTSTVLGLELCGELNFPDLYSQQGPWFPMNGPASASVNLVKKDTFSKIHMDAAFFQEKVIWKYTVELTIFYAYTVSSSSCVELKAILTCLSLSIAVLKK